MRVWIEFIWLRNGWGCSLSGKGKKCVRLLNVSGESCGLDDWKKRVGRKTLISVRFKVLTTASMKMSPFLDMASCAWWWKLYAPLKCRSTSTRLHGTISHKTVILALMLIWGWEVDGRTLGLCAVKGFSATDLDGRVVGWFISFMVTRLLREAPKNSEGNWFPCTYFFLLGLFENLPDFRSRATKHMCRRAWVNFRTVLQWVCVLVT
jgi:hypothetical protein